MPTTFKLARHGKTLSTRPRGAEVRAALLAAIDADLRVVLDCQDVLAVSYSFADEFAGKLAQGSPTDWEAVDFEIVCAADNVLAALTTAIERRTAPSVV